jgi:hypothetical protein
MPGRLPIMTSNNKNHPLPSCCNAVQMSSLAHQPNASDQRENDATENRVEEARLKSNQKTKSGINSFIFLELVFGCLCLCGSRLVGNI